MDNQEQEKRFQDGMRESFLDEFEHSIKGEIRAAWDEEIKPIFDKLYASLQNLNDPMDCKQTSAVFNSACQFHNAWNIFFQVITSVEELHQHWKHGPEHLEAFRRRLMIFALSGR